uniref:Uncharacterized protein n=1 Tax=Meloidogyne enterolobii TaxID=390850 RepID=A0A6V7VE71_MELEN|nr:unnamed protein product [Meloidogyne enterolobii]
MLNLVNFKYPLKKRFSVDDVAVVGNVVFDVIAYLLSSDLMVM